MTSLGRVHINVFGVGKKTVILSHGWSDNSSCFDALIPELVSSGYCVVAIDHVGHGLSAGKRAHLLAFVEALDVLIERLEHERHDIVALIGHSMGAVAIMNLPDYRLMGRRLVNIATPVQFFELMFSRVKQSGISELMLKQVLERITAKYNTKWPALDTRFGQAISKFKPNFIHDEQDKFAPFADVQLLVEQHSTPLFSTSGLGHRRILGDTSVIKHITKLVS
ncbi:alpha/beta hydrolase (plasmid) [Pseudoalteromonas sp. T1lg65]|uniref:alpha/beta hydrolase n=1 Tax=Pseudoalteromonas sp. T1lg65 TaxID=2077101 RepID=UPI003F7979A0